MRSDNFCGGHTLRIAAGITVMAILLLVRSADAATSISSCTKISSSGVYVLNNVYANITSFNSIFAPMADEQ